MSEKMSETADHYIVEDGNGHTPSEKSRQLISFISGVPFEDTYIVMFSYILGNHKSLISTTVEDGKYYEVTYNVTKKEAYVDTYVKTANRALKEVSR